MKPFISRISHHFKFILIFTIVLCFSFYRLGNEIFNSDAHFWYQRTTNFTKALKKIDLANTYQNPKPGVTVMWLSGLSLETFFTLYNYRFGFTPNLYTYETFGYIHFFAKLPLVITYLLFLIGFYNLLNKYLGQQIAIYSIAILGLEPYFLGIIRFFHGDGTLAVLMAASALILITTQLSNSKASAVAGLLAGLALLTKMQAVFLICFAGLIMLVQVFYTYQTTKNLKQATPFIINFLIYLTMCLLTFILFFPAMWVAPINTLTKMYVEAKQVTTQGNNGGDGSITIYITAAKTIFSYFFISTFILGISTVIYKFKTLSSKQKFIYFYSVCYLFFYTVQMCLVFQKSERYLLPLFPVMVIFSGTFLYYIFLNFKNLKTKNFIETTSLIFLTLNLYTYTPHYSAMAEVAPWGALYVEAANYLNNLPNAQNLNVVAIPKEHTFRPFFKGNTFSKFETLPKNKLPDYLIAHNINDIPEKYLFCTNNLQTTIKFKNKIFWNIYKCSN